MLKHTKRQVNEFRFPKCVLLSCLSPQFVCYFLLSYDGQRERVNTNLSYIFEETTISCCIPWRGKQKYHVTNVGVKSKLLNLK